MTSFEIRPVEGDEEGLSFFRMAARALLSPPADAEKWMLREGLDNVRLALVDGRLAGGLSVQRMGQWFGGRSVPCGAIRAVAIAPEFRGQNVAGRLLRHTLDELARDGIPLSMLFPATQHVYRRAGFEQAGVWVEYLATLGDFPSRSGGLEVTEVSPHDERLRSLYTEQSRRASGPFDRSDWLWRRTVEPFNLAEHELSAYLLGPLDAPEGYLLVHVQRGEGQHDSAIVLRDRALLTPAALSRAQSFLAHHRSTLHGGVRLHGGIVEPLLIGLPNQLQDTARRIDWMLRLTDPPAALSARGYHPALSAEIHLVILDDASSPAEQPWTIRVRDGRASMTPGGEARLRVDVRGLAAMYSGHLGASDAALLGYLQGDPAQAALLEAIFAGPRPFTDDFV